MRDARAEIEAILRKAGAAEWMIKSCTSVDDAIRYARDVLDPRRVGPLSALVSERETAQLIESQAPLRERYAREFVKPATVGDDIPPPSDDDAPPEVAGWVDSKTETETNVSDLPVSAPTLRDAGIDAHHRVDGAAFGLPGAVVIEPVTEPNVEAEDPWTTALKTSRTDVKAKLAAGSTGVLAPLFMDAADLLRREFTETPWQVTGLITRGGTAVIGGEPKTTKTWLATEIAIAVATGTKVCGEFYAERGRVAYFYAEDLDKQVCNRDRALLASRAVMLPAGQLLVQPRGAFIDVLRDEDLALIVASCRRFGSIDLLVLDPLRDISSAEEDKSDSMRDVMRRLRVLGELLGCTVLVVHHTAKASDNTKARRPGQRLRGSGAIHGSIDSGIYLSDTSGDGTASFVNIADSEVKGARSAGRFILKLDIQDNAQGEAERAHWTVTRPEEIVALQEAASDQRQVAQDQADRDAVVAFVEAEYRAGKEPRAKSDLRDVVPGVPDQRCRRAIARELGRRLALRDVTWTGGKLLRARVVPA